MWLSPFVRLCALRIVPIAALVAALGFWGSRPAQMDRAGAWAQQAWSAVDARPEFQIRQMAVTGASPALAAAIRDRVGLSFPVSWFDVDPKALQADLARLDAVAEVNVTLELGAALRVAVTARTPAILWRRHSGLELLDAGGHRIAFIDRRDGRRDLPLITGRGADRAVPEALAIFARAAERLGGDLIALTRQGERRWDVVLRGGQIVQLPEDGAQAAFDRLLAMAGATDLLERDITVVDLRNPARPTVRLGPAAVEYLEMTRAFAQGLATQ